MPVASAGRPKRETERRKTARRRSPATPHKRFSEHWARSESIAGAQQGITRAASKPRVTQARRSGGGIWVPIGLSRRTRPFEESVIREVTRLGAEVGGIGLAHGLPEFEPSGVLPETPRRPARLLTDAGQRVPARARRGAVSG